MSKQPRTGNQLWPDLWTALVAKRGGGGGAQKCAQDSITPTSGCAYALLCRVVLPCNAPQGFNALDRGVFYVLKGQTAGNLSTVHAQTDVHRSGSRHRRGRETHDFGRGPPGGRTRRGIYQFTLIWTLPTSCCRGKSSASHCYELCTLPCGGEDSLYSVPSCPFYRHIRDGTL